MICENCQQYKPHYEIDNYSGMCLDCLEDKFKHIPIMTLELTKEIEDQNEKG